MGWWGGWGVFGGGGGVACFGTFMGQILFIFFYFLSKYFLNFFQFLKIFYFFLFCGGTLLIFVQHSLIHSHNFFMYCGKCKCWIVCFFLFLSIDIQLINYFWKIRVALRRAGFGATCAG